MKYIMIILSFVIIFNLTGCREEVDYNDEEISAEYVNRLSKSVKISHVYEKTAIELDSEYTDYYYDNTNGTISFICGDKIVTFNNYGENIETIELPENAVDTAVDNDNNILIYNGNDIVRGDEIIQTILLEANEEFIDMYTDKLGRIYYFTSKYAVGMYRDGNIIFNMKISGILKETFQTLDGEILLHIDNKYVYLDVNNHKFDREIALPKVVYDYEIIMGNGFELYLLSEDLNLYGYTGKENVPVKLIDLINSGINIFDISDFKVITSGLMMYKTNEGQTILLNKVDSVDTEPKLPIKIASYGYDKKLLELIIDFNTFSKAYHINLIDYSIYNIDEDIAAGNIPDIFISDENLRVGEYIVQGMFVDLNTMNEKINLLDSISKAFSTERKLYLLPSDFKTHSFSGKTETIGNELYWSMIDFNNFLPELRVGKRLISNISYMNMLYLLTTAEVHGYLFSYTDGFKDEGYINLLNISLHVGSEIDKMGRYTGDNTEYINGDTMIYYFVMNQPDDYNTLYDVFGTDEISLKGIPTNGGNTGMIVEAIKAYSISKYCEAIDGAWEFIKILLYEYHDERYLSPVEEIFDEQLNTSALSGEVKDYISDIIKNRTPVNLYPMNYQIFDMIDAEVILLHAGTASVNYVTNAIDFKITRFIKKYYY